MAHTHVLNQGGRGVPWRIELGRLLRSRITDDGRSGQGSLVTLYLGDLVEYGLEFRAIKSHDPDSLPHPQAAARSKPNCTGRLPREGGLP